MTWQEFPLWPAEPDNRDQRVSVNFFDFAPGISLSESPPLFALLSGRGLYRSLDIGASWHQVWVMPEDDAPQQLALSPAFASDRLALILTRKGDIYRSVDAGATWHHQGDVLGRTTLGLTFLPGGTLFASLEASDDDDGRLGMAVSTDGGATFTPSQVALAPDEGSPLRTVRGMVPSPTYLTDQTVFAIAERPTTGSFCLNRSPVNPWLLRSVDGGAHWDAVHTPGSACGSAIRLGLSPTFASDGTGFYLRGTGGGSPASSRCLMYRTRDYGASWRNTGFDSGPYTACGDLHIAGGGTSLALYFRANYWFYSTDLGATRPLLPSPVPGSAISLMVGPRGPHDQMFAATTGGIWVTAPGHP